MKDQGKSCRWTHHVDEPSVLADGLPPDEKKLDSSPQITAYDDVDSNELTHSEAPQAPAQCPPSINERALVRRIDFRVLPVLFVIYLAAFLDR